MFATRSVHLEELLVQKRFEGTWDEALGLLLALAELGEGVDAFISQLM